MRVEVREAGRALLGLSTNTVLRVQNLSCRKRGVFEEGELALHMIRFAI